MRILCLRLTPPHRIPAQQDRSRRPPSLRTAARLIAAPPEVDRLRTAAELEEFSPSIGWHDWRGRWCFCLDVAGTSRWFGGEAKLLAQLRDWSDERRWFASAAIADSLGAAWAIMQFAASEPQAPFTARIVAAEQTRAVLAPLPIEALRLSLETVAVLAELGLTTLGPLFDLPREALAERFDPELLLRLDQACGAVHEWFEPYRPAPQYEVRETWEFGISSAEVLPAVWERLLPKLLAPLAARNRGVARLLAELHGETGSQCRLTIGLLRPSLDRAHLLGLLRLRLETVRLPEPIIGTKLSVLEEAPQAVQQQVLFNELAPPIESTAWTTLVERLSGRLGADRVLAIRSHPDHDPALAWKGEPWLARNRRRVTSAKSDAEPPPRPSRLLRQPRPIQVVALMPQGHPQQFSDRGTESRVVRSWGPERIETGWWRGPSLRRDYFRVETEAGMHVWVFRDLRSRRWFLHGWFD
jgi:protein ImuB